jgi:hypothetical protein
MLTLCIIVPALYMLLSAINAVIDALSHALTGKVIAVIGMAVIGIPVLLFALLR